MKYCPEQHCLGVGRSSHSLALALACLIFSFRFFSSDPLVTGSTVESTGRRDTVGMSQNARWHVHNDHLEKLLRGWKRVLLRMPYLKKRDILLRF